MQEEHGDNKLLSETFKGIVMRELLDPEDDVIPKVRKPYTITKQRERWTEEEHKKFLEALKLYGRAWRKIEEHVGSKTSVQIRSHAQKFFSKIIRETDNDGEESTLKPIEIPPPRPKRKPVHPYPRKMVTLTKPIISTPEKLMRSLSTNMSVSDNENQSLSPTSVLSVIGSLEKPLSPVSTNIGLESCNKSRLDAQNSSSSDERIMELLPSNNSGLAREYSNESNGQFLKLFGRTLLVADTYGPFSDPYKPESVGTSSEFNDNITSRTRAVPIKVSTDTSKCVMNPNLPWLTLNTGDALVAASRGIHSPMPIKAHTQCDNADDEKLNEGSSDLSNGERSSTSKVAESYQEFRGQVKNLIASYGLSRRVSADSSKGFVPYKRCVMERDSAASSSNAENTEERETQRIRLCSVAN